MMASIVRPIAGDPRVEGLPQLARQSLDLGEGVLRAADVARLEQRAGAMEGGLPGELAAADLTRQRRQLARECQSLARA